MVELFGIIGIKGKTELQKFNFVYLSARKDVPYICSEKNEPSRIA